MQPWRSGSICDRYLKYVQARRATKGAVAGERHCGARGRQMKKCGKPWNKFHRKQGFGMLGRRRETPGWAVDLVR